MNGNVFWLALQLLLSDKRKFYALVGGVAFAVHLMTVQLGVFWGVTFQTSAFIRDLGTGDLWVAEPSVRFSHERRPFGASLLSRIQSIDGVQSATPLGHTLAELRLPNGTKSNVLLIGVDRSALTNLHVALDPRSRWSDLANKRSVFVDSVTANKHLTFNNEHLKTGHFVEINKKERFVTGTFQARRSFFWEPTVLVTIESFYELVGRETRPVSYAQVRLSEGASTNEVAKRISNVTGLKAMTRSEFEASTIDYIFNKTGILINFAITVALGFLIGTFVSAQTLYSFTLERLKYYGTLRAFGMRPNAIVSIVVTHAAFVGLLGYGIGVLASVALGFVLAGGGLAFAMPLGVLMSVAIATTLMLFVGG
ncbi:MAG: ABC transporter permease, partial [Casimicrobium sp.]